MFWDQKLATEVVFPEIRYLLISYNVGTVKDEDEVHTEGNYREQDTAQSSIAETATWTSRRVGRRING